ncbi:MAG: FecR domain-containing protein, partial [Cyclobacteriaceae bacterium]|nr:FecR domain-containing protein [Cyclobacteriaceae bacterium]
EYADLKRIWEKRYFAEEDIELVSQKEANEQIWESVFEQEEKKRYKTIDGSIFIKIAAALIIFCTAAFVLYFVVENTENEIPQIIHINKQTLPGQKSTIPLPDGSIVYLNSGSSIFYRSDYNENLRIIELEGQAFFDIFKDKEKPFIVRCRELEVEALGTSFDVNGYSVESILVSLLSGSVKLSIPKMQESKSLILNPGEYSIVDKEYNIINKGNFNPYEVLAWKEGRLIFNNATLKEIIPKLELWYGVKIKNHDSIDSDKPFTSTFEKENLDNILYNMGNVLGFKHTIKGNDVRITNDVPM